MEPKACWAAELLLTSEFCTPGFVPSKAHFQNHFCPACREGTLNAPAARIRVLTTQAMAALAGMERSTHDFWKRLPQTLGEGHMRIINNTLKCKGPKLVCFRQEPPDLPFGEMPLQWLSNDQKHVPLRLAYGTICPLSPFVESLHPSAAPSCPLPRRVSGAVPVRVPVAAVPSDFSIGDGAAGPTCQYTTAPSGRVVQWVPRYLPMAYAQCVTLSTIAGGHSTSPANATVVANASPATAGCPTVAGCPTGLLGNDASQPQRYIQDPLSSALVATEAVAAASAEVAAEVAAEADRAVAADGTLTVELPDGAVTAYDGAVTDAAVAGLDNGMSIDEEMHPSTLQSMLDDALEAGWEWESWESHSEGLPSLSSLPPSPPSPRDAKAGPRTQSAHWRSLTISRLRPPPGGNARSLPSFSTPLRRAVCSRRSWPIHMDSWLSNEHLAGCSMLMAVLCAGIHYLQAWAQLHASAHTSSQLARPFQVEPLRHPPSNLDGKMAAEWESIDLFERAKRQLAYSMAVAIYCCAEAYSSRVRRRSLGAEGSAEGGGVVQGGARGGSAVGGCAVGGCAVGGCAEDPSLEANLPDMASGPEAASSAEGLLLASRVILTCLPFCANAERLHLTITMPIASLQQALIAFHYPPTAAAYACSSWVVGWWMMRAGAMLPSQFRWTFLAVALCNYLAIGLTTLVRTVDLTWLFIHTSISGAMLLGARHRTSLSRASTGDDGATLRALARPSGSARRYVPSPFGGFAFGLSAPPLASRAAGITAFAKA